MINRAVTFDVNYLSEGVKIFLVKNNMLKKKVRRMNGKH